MSPVTAHTETAPPAIIQSASLHSTVAAKNGGDSLSSTSFSAGRTAGILKALVASSWVGDAGFVIGEGPVLQNLVVVNLDKLSTFIWSNLDLSQKQVHEIDLGASYPLLNTKLKNGNLSFDIGAQVWAYPSPLLSQKASQDYLATATIRWAGPISISADYKHLVAGQSTTSAGHLLVLKASYEKEVKKFENGDQISIGIEVQLPYRKNFFAPDSKVPCIRPGASLRWTHKNIAIDLIAKYQIPKNNSSVEKLMLGLSAQRGF